MDVRAESLLTKEKKAKERGLEKKRKHTFHRKRLADYAPCRSGKLRPVGAKLKFHWDSSYYSESKADAKNLGPKARGLIPDFISGAEGESFHDENQKGQAHGELRKNVMKRDGESEMEAVDGECVFHALPGAATN
jgi:hypothetical protein